MNAHTHKEELPPGARFRCDPCGFNTSGIIDKDKDPDARWCPVCNKLLWAPLSKKEELESRYKK